jgi:hypothetical protein
MFYHSIKDNMSIIVKILMMPLLFFSIILLTTQQSSAQNIPFPDTIRVDSAEAERRGLFDAENRKTFKIIFSGKPGRAALYSLVIPGAGQAYNRKYWKVPIVWGAVGFFGYQAVTATQTFREMDKAYRCMLRGGECIYVYGPKNKEITIATAGEMRPLRDRGRNASERSWVTFSAIYLIQVFEAYIDRHLIDFDMDENLTFSTMAAPGYLGIGFTMNTDKRPPAKELFAVY